MKRSLALSFALFGLSVPALAQTTLYNASGGQSVSQYGGWLVNPPTLESFSSGSTLYSTVGSDALQGGFARADKTLSRTAGFALGFSLKVESETHTGANGPNRAGVSVIAITSDLLGIELGFWSDRVWAQSGPTFTKAEEGLFDTTVALANYNLQILGTSYQLWANGALIVSGPLRNYSSSGFLIYNTPNSMFFGDNTTSAQGSFRTSLVTLGAAAPEPATLGLLALGGLVLVRRRRG
jgi:PEP-CTERM motif